MSFLCQYIGHYIAWVKASATSAAETLGEKPDDPDKEQWVKVGSSPDFSFI